MINFFKKKKQEAEKKNEIHPFDKLDEIPAHVAIIMDGNGRWAQKKLLPRIAGHKEGMNTVKKITKRSSQIGIKVLTLYAFSTENWRRPDPEVNFLMQLPVDFFDAFVPDLIKENIKVQVIGFTDQLPAHTQKAVMQAIEDTKNNTGMILNFALNYGSRSEMIEATKQIAKMVKDNRLDSEEIDETIFESHLMTASLGDYQEVDFMIRTSGEERMSNFLLWQNAYSEFYFTKELWPDFNEQSLENAVSVYQKRHRRFGAL
ncbi:isoprenyl transferase [Carnobacterium sp. TMP28]|uniref:isoprenyl transferase n=1 Tax=Carnobacterium sp. TMP28 TaxID=3397060 RepID=UPI0039DF5B98